MSLLLSSGILLVFLSNINCSVPSHNLINDECAFKHTLCNPLMTRPCCDPKDECEQTWPDNLFRCVGDIMLWGLGKFCDRDEDCDEIIHAKCSKDHKCVCRMNNVRMDPWVCAPILDGFCWKNESCATNNTVCIDNTCQCDDAHSSRYNNQCIRKIIGVSCINDEKICNQIKFASCSKDKICTCAFNTTAVNSTYCGPIVGGYCLYTYECLTPNSVCINNKCECIKTKKYHQKLGCIAARPQRCLSGSKCNRSDLISNSICSEAHVCMCRKEEIKQFYVCTPLDIIHCRTDENCEVDNTICIDNYCQCKPKYKHQSDHCYALYLNEACTYDSDCSEIDHAVCLDNICVCDDKYIESDEKFCKPLLDGICSRNDSCVAVNSRCVDHKCQCQENMVKFAESLCTMPQLGILCENDFDCSKIHHGRCRENKRCGCMTNYVEYNTTVCVPLLGRYCSEDESCAPYYSSCVDNKCLCNFGFVQYSIDECVPHHIWMECESDDDCRLVLDSKCINNVCACKDNYVPLNSTVCVPILGQRCRENQSCATPNSYCIENNCQCRSDYFQTNENQCVTVSEYFYKSCQTDNDCYDIKYTICSSNKKCTCKSNYIPLGHRRCIALIYEFCDSDEECISTDTVCIDHTCQCSEKFYASSKQQCVRISLGVPCESNLYCSENIKNSECSKDRKCVCTQNHYALNEFNCVPLLFRDCSSNDDCRMNSSVCIRNKCVCDSKFRAISEYQCETIDYMYTCKEKTDCGDPWHYDCDLDKRCRCSSKHYSINKSTCSPLLNGSCWMDSQCLTQNSVCIDFHCQCKSNFVAVAHNLCRPSVTYI